MISWIKQLFDKMIQKIAYRRKLKKRLEELKMKDPYEYK